MATTTDTGFSHFDAPAMPGLTGLSLALRIERSLRRLVSGAAARSNDSLTGPSFTQLSPGLTSEISRS